MFKLNRVNKKAIINMLITAVLVVAILDIAALVVWIINEGFKPIVTIVLVSFLAFFNLIIIASAFIRYFRYSYLIDENRIVVREGILFVSTTIAPIERVHQITVESGPIDRLTGLAKVMATTAGGEIVVRFLEKELAEELAIKLEKTVKSIVKEQAQKNEE
ncbi:MAG: PH domain-containing protein [Clostridia bacterium]|nr:PH domain-containing protein [Clostridia bacterium]